MSKFSTFGKAISRLSAAAGCVLLVQGCAPPAPKIAGVPEQINYNWHVRPILSENCFKCHGPDPEALEAGLRLDVGELAVRELEDTPGKYAIVPHDSRRSESGEQSRLLAGNDRQEVGSQDGSRIGRGCRSAARRAETK